MDYNLLLLLPMRAVGRLVGDTIGLRSLCLMRWLCYGLAVGEVVDYRGFQDCNFIVIISDRTLTLSLVRGRVFLQFTGALLYYMYCLLGDRVS